MVQLEPANSRPTSVRHGAAGGDVLEEVVAFVIDEAEGGEGFDFDAPDGFQYSQRPSARCRTKDASAPGTLMRAVCQGGAGPLPEAAKSPH